MTAVEKMKKPKMAYLADINYQGDRPSYGMPPFKNKVKRKKKIKRKK